MCGGDPWVRRPPPPPPPSAATLGKAADVRDVQPGGNLEKSAWTEHWWHENNPFMQENGIFTFIKFYQFWRPKTGPSMSSNVPKMSSIFFSSACKIKSVTHLRTAPIECPSLLKFSWYRSAGRYSWKAHILNMCILSEILGDHLILFSRPGLAVRSSR